MSKFSTIQLSNIIHSVMDNEVEKIKDFEGFDPSAKGQLLGIRKMAKAIHDELQARGDNQN